MYCYKCGEKVFPEANFCHHCGADLTVIQDIGTEQKTSNESQLKKDQVSPTTSQETKVFKMPMQEDDEVLATYIKQVDENIQQEVQSQEERKKTQEKQAKAQKLEEQKKVPKKQARPEESGQDRKAQPKPTVKKPRKSLRDKWNSFIDESDNPYSVFSQEGKKDSKSSQKQADEVKNENILLINEDSERTHGPSEDRFQTASDISSLTRQVNEVLEQEAKKEQEIPKEKTKLKEKATEGLLKSFFKSFTKEQSTDDKKLSPGKEDKRSGAKASAKDASKQSVNAQIGDDEQKLNAQTKPDPKELKEPRKPKFFKTKEKLKNEPIKATGSDDKKPVSTPKKPKLKGRGKSLPIGDFHASYQKLIYKLLDFGQAGIVAIFALGLLGLAIPFFLIDTKITIALILFMLIKILISFFTIYYANIIASRNTGLYFDEKRMFIYAGFNWAIVNLVLFICFLFYPHDTAIGYNFLGALTPKLIPTILSYLIVSFLTLVSLYKDLDRDNYVNYMGWFLTLYIGINLATKFFWVLIDFIFNSIL